MMDLTTDYLGLKLANPLVPSSSPLTLDIDQSKQLEDAGASAIVMHSLFEESLHSHHPERSMQKVGDYLRQLEAHKQQLTIPIIASLNGTSTNGWAQHAHRLEQAGADALELNSYYVAADPYESSHQVETRHLGLVEELVNAVSIPVTVKLSPQCSSLGNFVRQLESAGAAGVSLFNRFYQPDIDLETVSMKSQLILSSARELPFRLRWLQLLKDHVTLSMAATGGIHRAEDVIKALVAGADVAQMCSALLRHGPSHITQVLNEMERWMSERGYQSIDQLRASLNQPSNIDPVDEARSDYLTILQSYRAKKLAG